MNFYESQKTRTKLDLFINNELKQTFDSYTHITEFLKIEYNDKNITDSIIKNLVKHGTITKGERFKRIYIYKNGKFIKKINTIHEFTIFCKKLPFLYDCSIIENTSSKVS